MGGGSRTLRVAVGESPGTATVRVATSGMTDTFLGTSTGQGATPQGPSHIMPAAAQANVAARGPTRTQRASTIRVGARPAAIRIAWNDNTQGRARGSRKGPVPPSPCLASRGRGEIRPELKGVGDLGHRVEELHHLDSLDQRLIGEAQPSCLPKMEVHSVV